MVNIIPYNTIFKIKKNVQSHIYISLIAFFKGKVFFSLFYCSFLGGGGGVIVFISLSCVWFIFLSFSRVFVHGVVLFCSYDGKYRSKEAPPTLQTLLILSRNEIFLRGGDKKYAEVEWGSFSVCFVLFCFVLFQI